MWSAYLNPSMTLIFGIFSLSFWQALHSPNRHCNLSLAKLWILFNYSQPNLPIPVSTAVNFTLYPKWSPPPLAGKLLVFMSGNTLVKLNLFLLITNRTFYLSPLNVWVLNRFLDWGLISISSFNFSTCLITNTFPRTATFTMKIHEFSQFKHGLLQYFDFSNKDMMEWVIRLARLFYVFSSAIWSQFIYNFFQVICLQLSGRDSHHLLLDLAGLLMLSIRGLLNLIVAFF